MQSKVLAPLPPDDQSRTQQASPRGFVFHSPVGDGRGRADVAHRGRQPSLPLYSHHRLPANPRRPRHVSDAQNQLLEPLGPAGSRRYCTSVIDLGTDTATAEPVRTAPEVAVLVVDGTFLQRPEIRDLWDERVWVDTPLQIARRCGTRRRPARRTRGGRAPVCRAVSRRGSGSARGVTGAYLGLLWPPLGVGAARR
jgi:hypothetical protein